MSGHHDRPTDGIARAVLEEEVQVVVDALDEDGVPLRVLGSLGVSLHCPTSAELLPAFERTYADIDFAAYGRDGTRVSARLKALGYEEDREVWMTSEGRRGLFDNPSKAIHVDVFYDRLEFCHVIPLDGRLDFVDNRLDPGTATMRARAILSNAEQLFSPGMFARVRLAGTPLRATVMLPDVGLAMPQIVLISVVLPAPFGPSSAKISPRSMVRSMSLSARKPDP